MSRRRCCQEGAARPRCLRRLRSTRQFPAGSHLLRGQVRERYIAVEYSHEARTESGATSHRAVFDRPVHASHGSPFLEFSAAITSAAPKAAAIAASRR
jgi:hypothetical protein